MRSAIPIVENSWEDGSDINHLSKVGRDSYLHDRAEVFSGIPTFRWASYIYSTGAHLF